CLKYFSVDNIKGERSLPRYVVTLRPPHRVARRSVFPSQPFPFPFASFLPRLPSQRVSFRAQLSALPWRLLLPLFPCDVLPAAGRVRPWPSALQLQPVHAPSRRLPFPCRCLPALHRCLRVSLLPHPLGRVLPPLQEFLPLPLRVQIRALPLLPRVRPFQARSPAPKCR